MRIRNRVVAQGADQLVVEGIRSDLQGMPQLYLGGRVFTPASLEDFILARTEAAAAIIVANAAWQKAIDDYAVVDRDTHVVLRDLKRLIVGAFGADTPKLARFGFTAAKQAVWTEEKKAMAVAKRAATRAARSTRGPKAKLSITGKDQQSTGETANHAASESLSK